VFQDPPNQSSLSDIFSADSFQVYSFQGKQLSFEVDYEVFRIRFWPRVAQMARQLSPLLVWTEIYSVIKGGFYTARYSCGYVPFEVYLETSSVKSYLSPSELHQVYMIFLKYESWKEQMKAYDFMDVVNHVAAQVKGSARQKIHFLMVDEVQDLTPNILQLFLSLVERNIFFSGDTAQTIARGVGFRFFDLKHLFREHSMPGVI